MNTLEFYRDVNVIRRILEYCGVPEEETAKFQVESKTGQLKNSRTLKEVAGKMTVEYLAGWGEVLSKFNGKKASSRYREELGDLLDRDVDIFRSLWDRENITFIIDLEYIRIPSMDGSGFISFHECLEKTESTYRCVMDIFAEYGINPMTLATGRGFHFVFNIPSYEPVGRNPSEVAQALTNLGHMEISLEEKYKDLTVGKKRSRPVQPELGKAYDALGKLAEFIVNKVAERLPSYGSHLIFNNQDSGVADFDLSPNYDPIFTRVSRIPFSTYTKHKDPNYKLNDSDFPVIITLPRNVPLIGRELSLDELTKIRTDLNSSAEYAQAVRLTIPRYTEGVLKMIKEYQQSPLCRFHEELDCHLESGLGHPELPEKQLPACLVDAIKNPEPKLRHIAVVQNLIRILYSQNWRFDQIANLIEERYNSLGGNGQRNWRRYHAKLCARVITRFYGGLLIMGNDDRADLNCSAQQRKGYCTNSNCEVELTSFVK